MKTLMYLPKNHPYRKMSPAVSLRDDGYIVVRWRDFYQKKQDRVVKPNDLADFLQSLDYNSSGIWIDWEYLRAWDMGLQDLLDMWGQK